MTGMNLEAHLRERRDTGRKLLVPYVTGGLGREWCDVVRAVIDAGADAVEIGIPFSDPIMDGRTIQEASQRALDLGATPVGVIDALGSIDAPVPLIVMTYYNLMLHLGHERGARGALAGGRERARSFPISRSTSSTAGATRPTRPASPRSSSRRPPPPTTGSRRSASGPEASSTACRSSVSPASAGPCPSTPS